jgi:NADH dehydrogenase/NADH:ubiquinone oxidoreductase subunit G
MEFGTPVTFKIHGREYEGAYGERLIDALRRYGYEVPSLCYHEAVGAYGGCRLCLVDVADKRGRHKITTSCNFPVQPGIDVQVETPEVLRHRRIVMELLLAMAPKNENLRRFARQVGLDPETPRIDPAEHDDCILCGLCERVCREVVGANALAVVSRGEQKHVGTPYDEASETCIACGACAWVCPTKCIGLEEKDGNRTIVRWKRTLPLAVCEKTGRAFSPKHLFDFFARSLGAFDETVYRKAPPYR